MKVTHSQSGSFKYTKRNQCFLETLLKKKRIENEGGIDWRFPLELQTRAEISVSLCAVLRNTQMLPRDRTNGNENNLITTLDQDDVVLLPISSHRLDVIDFVGLHHAGVVIPSNLNDALKQSIRNISLMNINGILQVQGGASLKLSDHGPISQVVLIHGQNLG